MDHHGQQHHHARGRHATLEQPGLRAVLVMPRALLIAIGVAVLVAAVIGFGVGVQAHRFARCQQLSAQYVAALGASYGEYAALVFRRELINPARDAYQRECA
jgi:hypothetical protein